jgi:LmbE family N-acetylglucosaminyl deacetylase
MRQERLLVAVAHPDDETFGCGSLIAHATVSGVSTVVVCATRGEAGSAAPDSGIAHEDLAVVRESELRDAARLLGVERVVLFDWHDSGIEGNAAAGTLVATSLHDVADAVGAVIDEFKPTVVVTLDGSDGHRDHAHMRDATVSAVERRALPGTRLYFHCLPRSLMRRWVEEMRRQQPDSDYLGFADLGTPDEQITTVIDTTKHLGLREQAIATHRSQTSPYEIMPADLRADFLSAERLRRVYPAWEGGPIETVVFAATVSR